MQSDLSVNGLHTYIHVINVFHSNEKPPPSFLVCNTKKVMTIFFLFIFDQYETLCVVMYSKKKPHHGTD